MLQVATACGANRRWDAWTQTWARRCSIGNHSEFGQGHSTAVNSVASSPATVVIMARRGNDDARTSGMFPPRSLHHPANFVRRPASPSAFGGRARTCRPARVPNGYSALVKQVPRRLQVWLPRIPRAEFCGAPDLRTLILCCRSFVTSRGGI